MRLPVGGRMVGRRVEILCTAYFGSVVLCTVPVTVIDCGSVVLCTVPVTDCVCVLSLSVSLSVSLSLPPSLYLSLTASKPFVPF